MTRTVAERFYALLPRVYRHRDALQGQPLRALLAVLEGEYQALAEDMQATYDNWFVDTCDQWVLPYLADLLGIRGLDHTQHLFPTQRRLVANALGYRRRKGTMAVLEHVLRDVTGWDVRGVEYFHLTSVTQHLATPRLGAGRSVDLRQSLALSQIGGAFEQVAHTMDVRASGADPASPGMDDTRQPPGYHPANLGIFVWRARAYPLEDVPACPIAAGTRDGCFTFDVAGRSIPLFNLPAPVAAISDRAEAANLAVPLTRQLLVTDFQRHAEQKACDDHAALLVCPAPAPNAPPQVDNTTFYGPDRSFAIAYRLGPGQPFAHVHPDQLVVADLSDWEIPTGEIGTASTDSRVVAVDPELGRMTFLGPQTPSAVGDVLVSYTAGYAADIGGGPYSREDALQSLDNLPDHALRLTVAGGGLDEPAPAGQDDNGQAPGSPAWTRPLQTLPAALAEWRRYCIDCEAQDKRPIGVIAILDNGCYGGGSQPPADTTGESAGDLVISLPHGAHLSIVAADGMRPFIQKVDAVRIVTSLERATLPARQSHQGDEGTQAPVIDRRLELDGIIWKGLPIEVPDQEMIGFVDLQIRHCTILDPGIWLQPPCPQAQKVRVQIDNSIVGPVRLPSDVFELAVSDSIVDPRDQPYAIGGSDYGEGGPAAALERVTILGAIHIQELKLASDAIFTGPLQVGGHIGPVRRSYVPSMGSFTLRPEPVRPDLAIQSPKRVTPPSTGMTQAVSGALTAHLPRSIQPIFTSTDPGHPGYAQLHPSTALEIRRGGQAGAEMGAFHKLYQHQREANLRRALEEYVPLGKHTSVHFVT